VALIGFMGCGKTTVARLLAARLGYAFLDLDRWLEDELKREQAPKTTEFVFTGVAREIMAVADMLRRTGIYPLDALREALSLAGSYAEKNLAAVAAIDRLMIVE
jgi:hypothetical protein